MNRRRMLSLIAGVVALPGMAHAVPSVPAARHRLRLVNAHTGEKFDGPYRDDSGPIGDAMTDLKEFLRDFRAKKTIEIDVGVIDFLAAVMDAVNAQSATILSAYRTPETNAMLARTTFGVADNSQHLYGRALDVHLDARLEDAMKAARGMERGGVGWYPHSGFFHIDTGPVRNWNLETKGLRSLLANSRRHRPNDKGREVESTVTLRSGDILPEAQHSGRILPELQNSGRLLPGAARSGRLLSELSRGHRL